MPKGPTRKQLRAYFLVEVQGCTHQEAASIIGICRSAVTRRLLRLEKTEKEQKAAFNEPKPTKKLSIKMVFQGILRWLSRKT